jgi:stage II sporulation protein D
VCAHPASAAGLSPAEALAQSCNTFFVAIARQLTRAQWSAAAVSLGLPPATDAGSLRLTAVGLAGPRVEPRAWVRALERAALADPVLRDGLEMVAREGTAAALGARGLIGLAKTGTAPSPGGGTVGLVAALVPAESPATGVVVLAPGGAGRDAAEIAARLLAAMAEPPGPSVRVGRTDGGTYRVERVPIEEYVAEVLAAEVPAHAPRALAEAMAIAARSWASSERHRHAAEGFDLCDLTHCQAMAPATLVSRAAARATRGHVLWHDGRVAQVFYTASCGGQIERARDVWPDLQTPGTWLDARPDPVRHAEDRWSATLDSRQIEAALAAGGVRGGPLRGLRVASRSASGRVAAVVVEGFTPATLSGDALRLLLGRHLGWQHVESTWFELTRTATGYRFDGRGRGHGVGLCVAGAERLARSGGSALQILATYFPGATVGPIPLRTRIRIVLPTSDEPARASLDRLARGLLDAVADAAGEVPPPALTLRFHPTVESYSRVTGQPWWTAASTQGDRVELLPREVLVRRGLLERTLAHELAHVVTAGRFAGRPRWVREGAAEHFADQVSGQARPGDNATSPASCPADADFEKARDAVALKALYGAAGACFSRWWAARTPASSTTSQPALKRK